MGGGGEALNNHKPAPMARLFTGSQVLVANQTTAGDWLETRSQTEPGSVCLFTAGYCSFNANITASSKVIAWPSS